jgi:hypothetical protein
MPKNQLFLSPMWPFIGLEGSEFIASWDWVMTWLGLARVFNIYHHRGYEAA